nr:MAG TPA: hypothetical protein [Bacteriophage sp.]
MWFFLSLVKSLSLFPQSSNCNSRENQPADKSAATV